MDITKVKAAIAAVKVETSALYKAAVAAGEKDPKQLNALKPLGSANLLLDRAVAKAELAAKAANGEKKDKKAKAAKESK